MSFRKAYVYLLLAVDSVHIDDGESRLGVVDNSIICDPSDGLPKIPGTSLHGVIRHNSALYAATHIDRKYLSCTGQIKQDHEHDSKCPVCWTFGRPPDGDNHETGHIGRVSIYDALILFFPVNTMYGLAYITTSRLIGMIGMKITKPEPSIRKAGQAKIKTPINLGMMMFYNVETCELDEATKPVMSGMDDDFQKFFYEHLYIVDETSFVRIVNGNLDVRTSVPIEPVTGVAAETGPFTLEAIPRGTILGFELIPNCDGFPADFDGNDCGPHRWKSVFDVVETGLLLTEVKGVGGISTRGMGRLKWINKAVIQEMQV